MKLLSIIKWALIVVAVALVVLFVVAVVLFFFPGNGSYHYSTNLADYGQCIGRSHALYCMLFPDQDLLTEDNCVFYDKYCFDGSNMPECLTYVLCSFSEEDFNSEVSRLENLASEHSDTYFNKPAYILHLNYVGCSEYALVDKYTHEIHYVSYYSNHFLDQLPIVDRIKPEYSDIEVAYKDKNVYF